MPLPPRRVEAQQAAQLAQRLASRTFDRRERRPGLSVLGGDAVAGGIRLDDHHADAVRDHVVQLSRDSCALAPERVRGALRRDVRDVVDLALAAMDDHAGRDGQQQEQRIDQRVAGVLGVVEVVDHRRRDQRESPDLELPPFEPGSDGEGDDQHGERDAEQLRRLRDSGHRQQGSDEAVDAGRGRSPAQRDHCTGERGSDHLRHPLARSPRVIGERELGRGTTQADDGDGEVPCGDGQPTHHNATVPPPGVPSPQPQG